MVYLYYSQLETLITSPVHCKYHQAGCGLRFSHARPQLRLQHEATCRYMTVTCHWAGDTCRTRQVSLIDIENHLLEEHGHCVIQVDLIKSIYIKIM